ncbi:MAG: hypothetical protein KF883_01460 [Thermomicrobiales bacterium]|nr:hypothetical protein [Thermomicrobiales bacterium]
MPTLSYNPHSAFDSLNEELTSAGFFSHSKRFSWSGAPIGPVEFWCWGDELDTLHWFGPTSTGRSPEFLFQFADRTRPSSLSLSHVESIAPRESGNIDSIFEIIDSASKRLQELSRLDANWDSYGARAVGAAATSLAYRLLFDVARRSIDLRIHHDKSVRPWFVAPLADGGIQIEWRKVGSAIEVEIGNDGSLAYLIEHRDGWYEDSGALNDSDWETLIDAVCRFLS